jgi:hypothetical protein
MRVHACELGADAIVDADIERTPQTQWTTVTRTDAWGRTRTLTIERPAGTLIHAHALAVRWVTPTANTEAPSQQN